jgi:hypothetical protein
VALAFAAAVACSRPLPEGDSAEAKVYVQECGLCHPPIHPGAMTPAMWRIQVDRMDELRRRRGLPPLAESHRGLILSYLDRNSG